MPFILHIVSHTNTVELLQYKKKYKTFRIILHSFKTENLNRRTPGKNCVSFLNLLKTLFNFNVFDFKVYYFRQKI